METTRARAGANSLILAGSLVAAVIASRRLPLADGRGHWLPVAVGLVFAAPAITLAGTVWSGWLSLREAQPRGFWSQTLFTLGIALCLLEALVIFWVLLGIGAA